MAIDTAIERRMAMTRALPFVVYPAPDGTVSLEDMRQAAGIYYQFLASTIEQALYSILLEDTTVAGLVSDRIYPNIISQGVAMPVITFQQITGIRDEVMDSPTGLVESRFQFNCWSNEYSEIRAVADAVSGILDGLDGIYNGVEIEAIHLLDEDDIPSMPAGNDILKRYGKRQDYMVWFKETV